ncbi:MAG: FxsA family protein [Ectothiorhodospiraceae bacterium]
MPLFLLILVVVPLVELFILIEVGQVIGALWTVGLCVATAVGGGMLLRQQGLETLRRARAKMDRGIVPDLELSEGLALAAGAVMLLTPGFATDVLGFGCVFPVTRRWLLIALANRRAAARPRQQPDASGGRDAIEGDYQRRPSGRDE